MLFDWIKRASKNKVQINYFFFSFIFLVLCVTHIYHISLIKNDPPASHTFFYVYATAEIFLEILFFILISCLIREYLSKKLDSIFVVIIFFLFLSHLIDFPLVRLMGMSIWFALTFLIDESYQNFIEMLHASNVSLSTWLSGGMIAFLLTGVGVCLFKISEKISNRFPLFLSYRSIVMTLGILPFFLCMSDYFTREKIYTYGYDQYLMALPWKSTLLPPKKNILFMGSPLKSLEKEEDVLQKISSRTVPLLSKPNIFIFIIESLREDFITKEIAPNFYQFKETHTSFDLALANSNATQISWFSLFFSKFPFYWTKFHPSEWKSGSIPLRILKELGYKIQVYTSARLGYCQMNEMIFGRGEQLVEKIHCFPHGGEVEACTSDQKTIQKLCTDLKSKKNRDGNVFVVFLDSTHFDYSWPKENTSFLPIEKEINYLTATSSNTCLEGIKNRYRNAIQYVDSLFGKFTKQMKKTGIWDESVIVMMGDHGEEFYEQGHLFHASNLSHPQMHIPIYYKLGNSEEWQGKRIAQMTSQMDIFPSIIHFITGSSNFSDLFEGNSIFATQSWPFTVTARYNASRMPYEFSIHNGKYKLIARFVDEKEIFKSKKIHLLSTKTVNDEAVPQTFEFIKENFTAALDRLF